MIGTLEFSLKLKSRPVVLIEVDDTKSNCTLCEFDGEGRDAWFDFVQSRMNVSGTTGKSEDVKVEIKEGRDMKGFQAKLLSLCLHNPDGNLFTEDVIQKFPSTVLSGLFDAAQKINGLTLEEQEEAKNE